MKTVTKRYVLGFGICIILFFLILPSLSLNAFAQSEGVIPITNNLDHQIEPVIYGDYIVWTDYRNDDGTGMNSDIYLYDLSTRQEHAISINSSRQVRPDIYGNWIVWEDNRAGLNDWDLWAYDLTTETEVLITQNQVSNQNNPAIYKNLVVWEDVGRMGAARHDNDIYIKDLSTGSTGSDYSITTEEGEQIDADIYGDYIVWTDRRSGNADIHIYDLSVDTDSDGTPNYRDSDDDNDNVPDVADLDPDPAEQPLITNPERQHNPAIYGDYVVYQDHRNGNSDIYMFNLKNNTEVALTNTPEDESLPRIYDNYVVYEKLVDTQRDIFYYDLITSTSHQITYQASSQEFPDIYGRYVIWSDYRNDKDGRATGVLVDNSDIYMYQIPRRDITGTPPIVTAITAIPESVEAGGEVTILVEGYDEDGDKLEYIFTTTGGSIEKVEDNIATWLAPDIIGYYNISAYTTDGEFFSNTMKVTVRVFKNQPPEIINVSIDPLEVKTGRATTIIVQANDPDDDKLVYGFICSEGVISGWDSKFDNEVTWTAPNNQGNYQIIVKVSDYSESLGKNLTTQEEIITISVLPRDSDSNGDSGFLPGFNFGAFELSFIIVFVISLKLLGFNPWRNLCKK
jgi:beta propeller repeat protein